jgi:hypothetical protein
MQDRWPGKLTLFEVDLLVLGSFDHAMEGFSVVYYPSSPFMIENMIRDGHLKETLAHYWQIWKTQ